MNYRNASIADLEQIKELLSSSKLPSDDAADHIDNFIVYEEERIIIGVGGLEAYGTTGLVRSIAVKPKNQKKGIGKSIYKSIEHKAYELGLNTLYLLTESAVEYFAKLGFIVKERTDIPVSVMNTKQYKALCPSTAILMFRKLSNRDEQKSPNKKFQPTASNN